MAGLWLAADPDEWSVEAGGGGICVVRVVHSLFASTDDWTTSWKAPNPAGLASPHPADLSHALPRPTLAMMQWMAPAAETEAEAWETLTAALG